MRKVFVVIALLSLAAFAHGRPVTYSIQAEEGLPFSQVC